MKILFSILFLALCFLGGKAQTWPNSIPTQYSTGYFRQGYHKSDSGEIIALRDTNWLPKYTGTMVTRPQNRRPYFYDSADLRWYKVITSADDLVNTNISNASLTANGNYAHKWGKYSLNIDSIGGLTFTNMDSWFLGAVGNYVGLRQTRITSHAFPSAFSTPIDLRYTMRNAANNADSVHVSISVTTPLEAKIKSESTSGIFSSISTSIDGEAGKTYIMSSDSVFISAIPKNTSDSIAAFGPRDPVTGTSPVYKIPIPSGGVGTVTSVALSMPAAFTVTGSPITTNGTLSVTGAGTALQYIRGNGTLATFDTAAIPSFSVKVRSLFSGTSPIVYSNGAISVLDATTVQKGVASFNASQFSVSSAAVSLADIVSSGSCTNCNLNITSNGTIIGYSSGNSAGIINAPGAGDSLLIGGDTLKRLVASFGLTSTPSTDNITWKADTTRSTGLPTYYYVDSAVAAGGGSGNTNSNIGSGFRWAVPNTNNIKTVFSDITGSWDSTSNANALTYKVDTSVIATQSDLSGYQKNLYWVNIVDYGADSTGNTNSSAAIQAAHDALKSQGGVMYIPPGRFRADDTIVITKPIKIIGAGIGRNPQADSLGISTIFTTDTALRVLEIRSAAVTLEDFNVEYTGDLPGTPAVLGSVGIYVNNYIPGTPFYANFDINRIAISGFYDNLYLQNANLWHIDNSQFVSATRYNVLIRDSAELDGGDNTITNCLFYQYGAQSGGYGIRHESGGGLSLLGCKFNGALQYGYWADWDNQTSVLNICNNSFENFTGAAINLNQVLFVSITNNEFAPYSILTESSMVMVDEANGISISNNTFKSHTIGAAKSAIRIINSNSVAVGQNAYQGFEVLNASPVSLSNNSLITVDRPNWIQSLTAGAITFDPSKGMTGKVTLTTNTTITPSNGQVGEVFRIIAIQDGTGGKTLSFSHPSVKQYGSISTAANDTSYIDLFTDGPSLYVIVAGASGGGGGTVTDFLFTDGSGFNGTVTNSTTTPTLALTTTLTAGSIPVIGGSGALTEDNANLFYDDVNNRMGLGTSSPSELLHLANVNGIDAAGTTLEIEHNSSNTERPTILFNKSRGSAGSKTSVNSGDPIGLFKWYGYDGSAYRLGALIGANADAAPAASVVPMRISFLTTPAGGSLTERMRITSDGELWVNSSSDLGTGKLQVTGTIQMQDGNQGSGKVLTSDANGIGTWQTVGYSSGTYTPTLTNILNISASTAYVCQYMQIGNVVTVSGKFDIDPTTASSLVRLGISLPNSTNFTADHQAGGTGTNVTVLGYTGPIIADPTNDRLEFAINVSTDVSNLSYYFTVTYLIDNS